MNTKIKIVATDKFEMQYFKFGTGKKTAVILPGLSVKSIMNSANSVVSAYKSMEKDYTVYVFDRRTVCPKNYSIKNMADDTAEALRLLKLKDIYLFGVSQGGMIAQIIALDYPELVHKLVLCSTIAKITKDNSKVLKEWLFFAKRRDEESLCKSMLNTVYSDAFNKKYGKILLELMNGASIEELDRFIILANSIENFDVYDRLNKINCPTLVIGSKADKVFEFKYIVELAERAGAQMISYEEYGHAVYDETPDCLKEIIKFFNK